MFSRKKGKGRPPAKETPPTGPSSSGSAASTPGASSGARAPPPTPRRPLTAGECLVRTQAALQKLRFTNPAEAPNEAFPMLNEVQRLIQQLKEVTAPLPPTDRDAWAVQIADLEDEFRELADLIVARADAIHRPDPRPGQAPPPRAPMARPASGSYHPSDRQNAFTTPATQHPGRWPAHALQHGPHPTSAPPQRQPSAGSQPAHATPVLQSQVSLQERANLARRQQELLSRHSEFIGRPPPQQQQQGLFQQQQGGPHEGHHSMSAPMARMASHNAHGHGPPEQVTSPRQSSHSSGQQAYAQQPQQSSYAQIAAQQALLQRQMSERIAAQRAQQAQQAHAQYAQHQAQQQQEVQQPYTQQQHTQQYAGDERYPAGAEPYGTGAEQYQAEQYHQQQHQQLGQQQQQPFQAAAGGQYTQEQGYGTPQHAQPPVQHGHREGHEEDDMFSGLDIVANQPADAGGQPSQPSAAASGQQEAWQRDANQGHSAGPGAAAEVQRMRTMTPQASSAMDSPARPGYGTQTSLARQAQTPTAAYSTPGPSGYPGQDFRSQPLHSPAPVPPAPSPSPIQPVLSPMQAQMLRAQTPIQYPQQGMEDEQPHGPGGSDAQMYDGSSYGTQQLHVEMRMRREQLQREQLQAQAQGQQGQWPQPQTEALHSQGQGAQWQQPQGSGMGAEHTQAPGQSAQWQPGQGVAAEQAQAQAGQWQQAQSMGPGVEQPQGQVAQTPEQAQWQQQQQAEAQRAQWQLQQQQEQVTQQAHWQQQQQQAQQHAAGEPPGPQPAMSGQWQQPQAQYGHMPQANVLQPLWQQQQQAMHAPQAQAGQASHQAPQTFSTPQRAPASSLSGAAAGAAYGQPARPPASPAPGGSGLASSASAQGPLGLRGATLPDVDELEGTLATFNERLAAEQHVQDMVTALDEAMAQADTAEAGVRQRRKAFGDALGQVSHGISQLQLAQSAAVEREDFDAAADLASQLDVLTRQRGQLEEQLGQLVGALKAATDFRLEVLRRRAQAWQALESHLQVLQTYHEENTVDAGTLAQHRSDLDARAAEIAEAEAALEARVSEAAGPVQEEWRHRVALRDALQAEVDSLRQQLAAKEAELAEALTGVAQADEALQQSRSAFEQEASQIRETRQRLDADSQALEARTREAEHTAQLAEALDASAKGARRLADAAFEQLQGEAQRSERRAGLLQEHEAALAELNRLEARIMQLTAELGQLASQRVAMAADHSAAQQQLMHVQATMPDLERAKKAAAAGADFREAARLSSQLRSAAAEAEAASAVVARVSAQLAEQASAEDAKAAELEGLRCEVVAAQARAGEARLRYLLDGIDGEEQAAGAGSGGGAGAGEEAASSGGAE